MSVSHSLYLEGRGLGRRHGVRRRLARRRRGELLLSAAECEQSFGGNIIAKG
jgi:hypothetical protein